MALKLINAQNGSKPNQEWVVLKVTAPFKTKGYAVVDRTFDEEGRLSNEFRHIYILPDLNIQEEMNIYIHTGKGTDGIATYPKTGNKYYNLYWGSDTCIWNDKGGDTATLISFVVVNSIKVPTIT